MSDLAFDKLLQQIICHPISVGTALFNISFTTVSPKRDPMHPASAENLVTRVTARSIRRHGTRFSGNPSPSPFE